MAEKGKPVPALAAPFTASKLVGYLLREEWHAFCDIIPDYEPPFPLPGDKTRCIVRFNNGTKYPAYLRYSAGPLQGFFWDSYGDDMQSIELSILALHQAPTPRSVAPIKVTVPFRATIPKARHEQ